MCLMMSLFVFVRLFLALLLLCGEFGNVLQHRQSSLAGKPRWIWLFELHIKQVRDGFGFCGAFVGVKVFANTGCIRSGGHVKHLYSDRCVGEILVGGVGGGSCCLCCCGS